VDDMATKYEEWHRENTVPNFIELSIVTLHNSVSGIVTYV
jgi:hypothetical protein